MVFYKKNWKDSLIALVIIFIPFILYLHTLFDDGKNSLNLFVFVIHHNCNSSDWFVYSILLRIINIALLFIWRFTTVFRWKNFIYIPIALFLFQLVKIHLQFDGIYEINDIRIALRLTLSIVAIFILMEELYVRFKSHSNSEDCKDRNIIIVKWDLNNLINFHLSLKKQLFFITEKANHNKINKLPQLYHLKSVLEEEIQQRGQFKVVNKIKPYYYSNTFGVDFLTGLYLGRYRSNGCRYLLY